MYLHNDWQSGKRSVVKRIGYLFDNKLMSDVTFTCGTESTTGRVFHAHKLVLATSSVVFYAMFYGNFSWNARFVHVEDIDEKSFEQFLRFVYTDVCEIT